VWLTAFCVALAYAPLLIAHGTQLWLRPHYQFFPVALLGAALLAWQRLRGVKLPTGAARPLSYSLLASSIMLLVPATVLDSSWLGCISALVLLAAALADIGGIQLLKLALPVLVALALVVPPPFGLDRNLILNLQTFTSLWSSRMLDTLNVFHVLDGHVVEVSGRRLFVEEACAGINSLFSLVACTLLYVLWMRRWLLPSVLLLAAAVGWALAANVVRVVLIVYLLTNYGLDLAEGWRHDALSMALFGLALVLVWSTDRLLLFLATARSKGLAKRQATPSGNKQLATPLSAAAVAGWGWLASPWVAGIFGVLAATNVLLNFSPGDANARSWTDSVAATASGVRDDFFPLDLAGWHRQGYSEETRASHSAFGEHSKMWIYRRPLTQAVLSLDYPFPAWHDLTRCYTSQGWVIDEEAIQPSALPDNASYVALRLTKPGYHSGYLLFAEIDGKGKILATRFGGGELSLVRHRQILHRLQARFTGESTDNIGDPAGPIYQMQLFVDSYTPLPPAERRRAQELFEQSLQRLQRRWTAHP
jgi:exosortase